MNKSTLRLLLLHSTMTDDPNNVHRLPKPKRHIRLAVNRVYNWNLVTHIDRNGQSEGSWIYFVDGSRIGDPRPLEQLVAITDQFWKGK